MFPVPKDEHDHGADRATDGPGIVNVVVQALDFPTGTLNVWLREQVIFDRAVEQRLDRREFVCGEATCGLEAALLVAVDSPGGGESLGMRGHDLVLKKSRTMCRKRVYVYSVDRQGIGANIDNRLTDGYGTFAGLLATCRFRIHEGQ